MGSRAIVVVCRDAAVARERFGIADRAPASIYTRTGRPFFDDPRSSRPCWRGCARRSTRAGLWDELDTDWLVLDCRAAAVVGQGRWSCCARQYAAVGAAGAAALGRRRRVLRDRGRARARRRRTCSTGHARPRRARRHATRAPTARYCLAGRAARRPPGRAVSRARRRGPGLHRPRPRLAHRDCDALVRGRPGRGPRAPTAGSSRSPTRRATPRRPRGGRR